MSLDSALHVQIDLNIQWSLFTENKHNMLLLAVIIPNVLWKKYNRTILSLFSVKMYRGMLRWFSQKNACGLITSAISVYVNEPLLDYRPQVQVHYRFVTGCKWKHIIFISIYSPSYTRYVDNLHGITYIYMNVATFLCNKLNGNY